MYGIGGGVAAGAGGASAVVLAATGAPIVWPIVLGVVLIVAGVLLLRARRARARRFEAIEDHPTQVIPLPTRRPGPR
ncbi:LPXTG cell wall anchor domain-containing protein [Amycolatopsis anabasis]|uniref:LPXTG cell wall anchor domain-containing protein n=1 Tax=Amycolatopsis anabasis TaxID=1840409 RepID=UPI0015D16592|nr:LPXTG cell wall anchor domain-containing protein [Amycolatopsis anabasis]